MKFNINDNYLHVISPTWNQMWLMFDLSNGHAGGRTYFWVFGTKKDAIKHRRKQHRKKSNARLSYPQKVSLKHKK